MSCCSCWFAISYCFSICRSNYTSAYLSSSSCCSFCFSSTHRAVLQFTDGVRKYFDSFTLLYLECRLLRMDLRRSLGTSCSSYFSYSSSTNLKVTLLTFYCSISSATKGRSFLDERISSASKSPTSSFIRSNPPTELFDVALLNSSWNRCYKFSSSAARLAI